MNTRSNKKKIRILIADDNQEVRGLFKGLLLREDAFEIVGEAANGVEALQLLSQHHPDVLLLDLSMPVMDGFAVIDAVKTRGYPVRILILSSHSRSEFAHTNLVSGAVVAFLNKFEDIDRVVETIKKIRLATGGESEKRSWEGESVSVYVGASKKSRALPDY